MSRESQEFDLSIGEAELVRESLDLHQLETKPHPEMFAYQKVGGIPALVDYLQDKYGKRVVIDNGAKGAIHTCLSYMRSVNKSQVNVITPYWSVLNNTFNMYDLKISSLLSENKDSFNFIVSPNNPDGSIFSTTELCNFTIQDAVYNLDYFTTSVKTFGDVQIYSSSKMLGLSGMRVGWIVSDNEDLINFASSLIEEKSSGVSSISQNLVLEALQILDNTNTSYIRDTLISNKNKLLTALQSYGDFKYSDGIFIYGKLHKKLPEEIKVSYYPDYFIRINACYLPNKISNIVKILCSQ